MAIKVKKEEKKSKFELKGSSIKKNEITEEKVSKKVDNETYFDGVKRELKEVKWPTKKDMVKYAIAVIVFVVVMSLFAFLIQFVYAALTRI